MDLIWTPGADDFDNSMSPYAHYFRTTPVAAAGEGARSTRRRGLAEVSSQLDAVAEAHLDEACKP